MVKEYDVLVFTIKNVRLILSEHENMDKKLSQGTRARLV